MRPRYYKYDEDGIECFKYFIHEIGRPDFSHEVWASSPDDVYLLADEVILTVEEHEKFNRGLLVIDDYGRLVASKAGQVRPVFTIPNREEVVGHLASLGSIYPNDL